MFNYFDLNNRLYKAHIAAADKLLDDVPELTELPKLEITKPIEQENKGEEIKTTWGTYPYAGATQHLGVATKISAGTEPALSIIQQIIMYFGVFIGILFSTAVSRFKEGGNVNLTISIGTILISAVIALVIIPVVYEKLNLNPKAPFIVQFGLFVQHGVFWHVIIDSIGKAI